MINVLDDRKPNDSQTGIAHWDDIPVYAINTLTPTAVMQSPVGRMDAAQAMVYTNLAR